jgi:hypothetical protein
MTNAAPKRRSAPRVKLTSWLVLGGFAYVVVLAAAYWVTTPRNLGSGAQPPAAVADQGAAPAAVDGGQTTSNTQPAPEPGPTPPGQTATPPEDAATAGQAPPPTTAPTITPETPSQPATSNAPPPPP